MMALQSQIMIFAAMFWRSGCAGTLVTTRSLFWCVVSAPPGASKGFSLTQTKTDPPRQVVRHVVAKERTHIGKFPKVQLFLKRLCRSANEFNHSTGRRSNGQEPPWQGLLGPASKWYLVALGNPCGLSCRASDLDYLLGQRQRFARSWTGNLERVAVGASSTHVGVSHRPMIDFITHQLSSHRTHICIHHWSDFTPFNFESLPRFIPPWSR